LQVQQEIVRSGSWSQCVTRCLPSRLTMNREFGVPPLGGPKERCLRTVRTEPAEAGTPNERFMVPMHAQKRKKAFHEPPRTADFPVGRLAGWKAGVTGTRRFMVSDARFSNRGISPGGRRSLRRQARRGVLRFTPSALLTISERPAFGVCPSNWGRPRKLRTRIGEPRRGRALEFVGLVHRTRQVVDCAEFDEGRIWV
jgi:hypothetical protein